MSDFFQRLEHERQVYFANIAIGGSIGIIAVTAFVRFCTEPSSVFDYIQAVPGAIPGAFITAGIIDYRETHQSTQ